MTAKRRKNRPTDAELAILGILWRRGSATVREVHEDLGREETVGYTTALKMLQIMKEKQLVERDDRNRAHVYSAVSGEEETQKRLVEDLAKRAFRGSMSRLVLQALSAQPASAEELDEIRRMLDEASEKGDEQ